MTHPTVTIDVPLTPNVLAQSGVSLTDALWIHRARGQKTRAEMIQRTARGKDVIFRVKQFMHQSIASSSSLGLTSM